MPRILLTSGPDDWQKMLAHPEKHWRDELFRTHTSTVFTLSARDDLSRASRQLQNGTWTGYSAGLGRVPKESALGVRGGWTRSVTDVARGSVVVQSSRQTTPER